MSSSSCSEKGFSNSKKSHLIAVQSQSTSSAMAPPPAKSLPPMLLLPTLFALSIAALVLSIIATRFRHNEPRNPLTIYDFVSETYVDETYGWMLNLPDDLRLGGLWAIFGISIVMVLLTLGVAVTLCSGVHGVSAHESRVDAKGELMCFCCRGSLGRISHAVLWSSAR